MGVRVLDIIQTKQLLLRGIDEKDAEIIVEWRSDVNVYKYFKSPHQITLEEHLRWYCTKYLFDKSRYDWICIEKMSGNRIGIFGLLRDGEKAEISYLLAPEAQHKGYAIEVIRELIVYAEKKWNCKQIVAEIHKDNKSSIKLVKKLGFSMISCLDFFYIYGMEI